MNSDVEKKLFLRAATLYDRNALFRWRNDIRVRAQSIQPDLIAWEEHCAWLEALVLNPNQTLLIAEVDDFPVGVLRFDVRASALNETHAIVSIYRVPGGTGKSLAAQMLVAGHQALNKEYPELQSIYAEIKPENVASIRAFLAAGYTMNVSNEAASANDVVMYVYRF